MQFQKILVPLGAVLGVVVSYEAYGWAGVALTVGALVMWLLLHYNRLVQVLKRATNHPIGYVASAVMLNAKLKPGVNLLHVLAMTRALGQLQSPPNEQPELFRWTDGSASHVTCEFLHGKLVKWVLERPLPSDDASATPPTSPAP
ncbi:MAG: glycerate kinase [Burkholderiaceae bacterium]